MINQKQITQSVLTLIISSALFLSSCSNDTKVVNEQPNISPLPVKTEIASGVFKISSDTKICSNDDLKNIGLIFSERLTKLSSLNLKTSTDCKTDKSILLKIDNTIAEDEGYKLDISSKGVVISGKNNAGVFYGVQTLLQMIPSDASTKKNIEIANLSIKDAPFFKWRGMHLDVSRHFLPKQVVKDYIDILAMHKLNVFHWHLTDDQGWRIEIKKHPKLTEIGAWRQDRTDEAWAIDDDQRLPYDQNKPLYGGFYTQEDIKEVVAYATARNITVVPEIEMPGHSRAALVAYPELSCFAKDTEVAVGAFVGENWDFSDPFCAGNEDTFKFFEDVIDEVLVLFPSEYIHIGGDECTKTRWSECDKCQARIKEEGLKDEVELQSYFMQRMEKYINNKGRKIIGWEEILEGGMNPTAAIMPWKFETALEVCVEAAKGGHEVIMSPSTYYYFNLQWPFGKVTEPQTTSLKTVYDYNPIPDDLDDKYKKSIVGVEAAAWTEYIQNKRDLEYQTMLRIAALSETAWTNPKEKNYNSFVKRLENLKSQYVKYGYSYYVPNPSGLTEKTVFNNKILVKINKQQPTTVLKYTTDGSEPNVNSKVYEKEFYVTETTTVKVAAFDNNGQKSDVITGLFDKQDYRKGDDVKNVKKGIVLKTFKGKFRSAKLIKGKKSTSKIINTVTITEKNNEVSAGHIFNGYINIKEEGVYTFNISSNDGCILYIDGKTVVNYDSFHNNVVVGIDQYKSGQVALGKGYHNFSVKYFDWGTGEFIKILIESDKMEKQELSSDMLFH